MTDIRISGERGSRDLTQVWTVTSENSRGNGYIVERVVGGKRKIASIGKNGGNLMSHHGHPHSLMKHCTVEII